jgi:hypothetical protein
MQIYSPTLKGPLKVSGFIDPDDITTIHVYWNAPEWSPRTVYRSGDITRPTSDNGYYYQCAINGVSGNTQPAWGQEETVSGTVTYTAVPWNLWLLPNENIANSTWSSSNTAMTLVDNSDLWKTFVTLSNIPASLQEFTLTNQVTKNNNETLSRSFLYKINQQ